MIEYKIKDRVKQTTYHVGLANSVELFNNIDSFISFDDAYNDGDIFSYCITDGKKFEIAIGMYSAANDSIVRQPGSLISSDSNNPVIWPQGIKEVFVVNRSETQIQTSSTGFNDVPTSGSVPYFVNENQVNVNNNFSYQNDRLIVGNLTSSTNAQLNEVELSGYIEVDSVRQTTAHLDNELDDNTEIDQTLELTGDVNQVIGFKQQGAGLVLSGPVADCGTPPCPSGFPVFRALIASDIPEIDAENVNYNPLDDSDWISTPTNVQNALDNLAEDLNESRDSANWGSIEGSLSDQTDLNTELLNREPTFSKNTGFNKDFGNQENTVVEGNDPRLSDARQPTPHVHDIMDRRVIVENQQEFNDSSDVDVSQDEIFNSWYRFSHFNLGNFPHNASELNQWSYDNLTNTISCTINSASYIGFISENYFENYELEAVFKSNNADDDVIGFVVAFYEDPITGNENTLSVLVCRGGTGNNHNYVPAQTGDNFSFALVYNYQQADAKIIGTYFNETGSPYNGAWTNNSDGINGIKVKVVRNGDTITAYRSSFDFDKNLNEGVGEFLTIDLNSDADLVQFKGKRRYGYSCFSQDDSTFTEISFSNNDDLIYNIPDNNVYRYDKQLEQWVIDSGRSFSDLGINKFIFNENTEKLFYVNDNVETIKVSEPYIEPSGKIVKYVSDSGSPNTTHFTDREFGIYEDTFTQNVSLVFNQDNTIKSVTLS